MTNCRKNPVLGQNSLERLTTFFFLNDQINVCPSQECTHDVKRLQFDPIQKIHIDHSSSQQTEGPRPLGGPGPRGKADTPPWQGGWASDATHCLSFQGGNSASAAGAGEASAQSGGQSESRPLPLAAGGGDGFLPVFSRVASASSRRPGPCSLGARSPRDAAFSPGIPRRAVLSGLSFVRILF